MACQRIAYAGASAKYHVEDALRQRGLVDQLSEQITRERCIRARLDDDGITGDQGRCHFSGNTENGEIPGQDAGSYADWFLRQQDPFVRTVALDDFAINASAKFGKILKIVDGVGYFALRTGNGLALFFDELIHKFIVVVAHELYQFFQIMLAFDARQFRPGILSSIRCFDSLIDVFFCAIRDLCAYFFCCRIDDINHLSIAVGNECSIDIHLTGFHIVVPP